jgi:ribosomal protein L16 Arg81 hydroxylase
VQENGTWELRQGPFEEDHFASLPPEAWQLLVRGVDRVSPAVADLARQFTMLPRWQLDDVMVSFGVDKGTVGPHSDSFHVFLLQGEGHKRWSVDSGRRVQPDDVDAHIPVRHSMPEIYALSSLGPAGRFTSCSR